MSDTPNDSPSENPSPSESKETPMAPWYRRPVPLVGIVVLILILAILIPPVVADEIPVGLSDQGEQNAEAGGWERDPNDGATRALGGLMLVDPVTMTRETAGIPDGVYIYTTVKIPAMLPNGLVFAQMHSNAVELLQESGVQVHTETAQETSYDGNGHDVTMTYYSAIAENEDFFLADTEVDLFIATWRCSLLGSYAVSVGAAPKPGYDAGNDGVIDPFNGALQSSQNGSKLQEIERELLAHTHCEE